MSKHTPGPWKFEKDGSIEHNNVENYIDGADGTLIVYGHVKDADARLIAAAPDLLEALLTARDHIDMAALAVSHYKDAERITAAIAKATGETK